MDENTGDRSKERLDVVRPRRKVRDTRTAFEGSKSGEQGGRSIDSAGAIGTPWRDMGDRKNRFSESEVVYQKDKICQAVNKWFKC